MQTYSIKMSSFLRSHQLIYVYQNETSLWLVIPSSIERAIRVIESIEMGIKPINFLNKIK